MPASDDEMLFCEAAAGPAGQMGHHFEGGTLGLSSIFSGCFSLTVLSTSHTPDIA